ncbi:MAG: hypothetical protein ACJA1I_000517 [Zhongshania marina]|jgi:hypothetical protein
MKPEKVNILGIEYQVEYVDKPSDVDIHKRESLWGQIDYWTRTIRIYDNGRPHEDVWQTIIHEVLHGIADALKMKLNKKDMHDELDILALAITDVFYRNGWIKT